MIGLGIESTAHTFSCAIIEKKGKKGKILSDVRKIFRPEAGQGIHPREASRHHIENSPHSIIRVSKRSKYFCKRFRYYFICCRTWIRTVFRVGAVVARSLSSFYKIPIYPVNHAIGHIELGKLLTGANDPLVLLVSGGHTMLLSFLNKQWRVFGETLDITLGQLLDQFGRSIGFASPCGKNIEELASTSTNYVSLPYSVKGNDVSFSGLLSATKPISEKSKVDACYSLQETAFAMISETVERALSFTSKKELMIVGGVAANKRLSEMLKDVCKRHGAKFFVVPLKYAGDCGSQICWTGLLESQVKKSASLKDTFVTQSWRLDSVIVNY